MKINEMKTLINMYDEWVKLQENLRAIYKIYKDRPVQNFNENEVEEAAVKFLKIAADLYDEEYDEINQLVDFHLDYGVYTLVFDRQIHSSFPCYLGLRMSSYVEGYDDIGVSQEIINEFFDDNFDDNVDKTLQAITIE